jgi:uncharacterized membrane protein YjjB (DUF3815 family)
MIINMLWAGVVAFAFAVIFNAPRRVLAPIVFLGMLALMVRAICREYDFSLESATFVASLCIGILSILFSNRQKVPVLVYAICSSIVLVPSLYAYKAMIGIIQISTNSNLDQEFYMQAFQYGIKTWIVFGAIVLGLIIPMQFFQRFRFRV